MKPTIISVTDLSKTYRVYAKPWDRLRELVIRRRCHQAFDALSGVSFELRAGEGFGVIGENGAGKSTLLKLLCGVTFPTRGKLEMRGQVASLLELGMGFHPEFTGRQNIRLNAAMMGIAEDEIGDKIPQIIAFSELGEFIDRPVKTYSTGMAMRLGFSIASHVDPEILIIDEALSVGDGYFQKKCMDHILNFLESGRTLLFCSHAMYYVSAFCQRALWLRHGRVAALGPVDEVVREYENFLLAKSEARGLAASESSGEAPSGSARLVAVRQLGEKGEAPLYRYREPWILEIEWESQDPRRAFHLGVGIDRIDGVQICSFGTHRDGLPPFQGKKRFEARLLVPELPVLKGEFSLYIFLLDEEGLHVYDQKVIRSAFSVETPQYQFGLIQAEHSWDTGEAPAAGSPDRGSPDRETVRLQAASQR